MEEEEKDDNNYDEVNKDDQVAIVCKQQLLKTEGRKTAKYELFIFFADKIYFRNWDFVFPITKMKELFCTYLYVLYIILGVY